MKKVLALLLTAGIIMSFASCGKEPEQTKEKKKTESSTQSEQTVDQGWEGSWKATDSDENFKIYDLTDKGFKCEFYHVEEGQIEKFDYEMEFDDDNKTVASEKGSADDNGGWEYIFTMDGGKIKVTWQNSDQYYTRVG